MSDTWIWAIVIIVVLIGMEVFEYMGNRNFNKDELEMARIENDAMVQVANAKVEAMRIKAEANKNNGDDEPHLKSV